MNGRMTEERLEELENLQVDACSGDAPYNPDVWALNQARIELTREVRALKRDLERAVPASAGTTPERIAEIEARHDAATEGPWESDESDLVWRLHGIAGRIPAQAGGKIPAQTVTKQILKAPKTTRGLYADYWPEPADADFITHAWADMRDMRAERARLARENAELRARAEASAEEAREKFRAELIELFERAVRGRRTNAEASDPDQEPDVYRLFHEGADHFESVVQLLKDPRRIMHITPAWQWTEEEVASLFPERKQGA